jgi:maleate isomerase
LVHGWERALQIQKDIQSGRKVEFVMMGVEVVHALRHLKCNSIAIASTYYSGKMSKILNEFLKKAGFSILKSENWQLQGIVEDIDSHLFIGNDELDPMDWKTPAPVVKRAVRDVNINSPNADCILVTGGGMRLLDLAASLEEEVGKPVIGGDIALYWGILRRLNVKNKISRHGILLSGLG